jgi:hypothetical protein
MKYLELAAVSSIAVSSLPVAPSSLTAVFSKE